MRIYSEASFKPVALFVEVDGTEEAIAVANDTMYGLSAAVFSRDAAIAPQIAQRIKSGICHVSGATVHDEPRMPFGEWEPADGDASDPAPRSRGSPKRWITIQAGACHYPI
ncbi:aldehyde dehydrogenase family protein [Streptomyces sp. NPDC002144]